MRWLWLLLYIELAEGLKGTSVTKGACAADEDAQCLDWCSEEAASTHCTLCSCQDCDWCAGSAALRPPDCISHDSHDSDKLQCLNWCDESNMRVGNKPRRTITLLWCP